MAHDWLAEMHAHRVPRSRHTRGTGAPGPAAPQPLLTGGGRALPAAARDRSRAAGARGARHGARRPDTGAARGPAQHISLAGLRVVNSPKAARLRLRTGQPRTATRARVPRTSRSTGTARTGRAVRSVLCATVGGRRANWVDVDQGLLSGCSVCVPSPTHSLWRARRRLEAYTTINPTLHGTQQGPSSRHRPLLTLATAESLVTSSPAAAAAVQASSPTAAPFYKPRTHH